MKLDFYKQKNSILLIIFYLTALILAFANLQDFGIHIEEKFHRLNGHYWLNYIAKQFGFVDLQKITEIKINSISDYSLSSVSYYNKYGVILDLPIALIEVLFDLKNTTNIYYLKHLLGFIIFLISSLFFFKILSKRFDNFYINFFGLFLYVSSPRILGDSFLYKDVLFLSFFTISVFFFLECINKISLKNLLYFSLFNALALNLRIVAIFLPIFFLLVLIIKNFYINIFFKNYKKLIIYFLSLVFFVFIFWPYLWEDPFLKLIELFSSLKTDLVYVKILYFNKYIPNAFLPSNYIINWIFISSPIFQIIFFSLGYIIYTTRFYGRFLRIENKSIYNDLWRSKREEKDFIFFLFLTSFFFIFIFSNLRLYNGWRLVYFLNIFILYFGIYFLDLSFKYFRKNLFVKNCIKLIIFVSIFYNSYAIFSYHPFQSLYFNSFLSEKIKNSFEGDYHGISAKHFFQKISKIDKRNAIKIAVASHTPLHRGLEGISPNLKKRFEIVGQEYHSADYIYKNNISEVNSELNKKYEVPENFSKIYELKINKVKIYEIYKFNG